MKAPAFQFYVNDFLGGTLDMSPEEIGAYILLLCHQWSRGSVPADAGRQQIIARGPVSAAVRAKFEVGADGELRNARMEEVRQKQLHFKSLQRTKAVKSHTNGNRRQGFGSGSAGGPAAVRQVPEACSPVSNLQSTHTHTAGAREANWPEVPSWEAVLAYAERIGVPEWRVKLWFDDMEGAGWKTRHGHAVCNWQALVNSVKTWWEADGRPAQPKGKHASSTRSDRAQRPNRNEGTYNDSPGGPSEYARLVEVVADSDARRRITEADGRQCVGLVPGGEGSATAALADVAGPQRDGQDALPEAGRAVGA